MAQTNRQPDLAAMLVALSDRVARLERPSITGDISWQPVSFVNSWANFGGGTTPAHYRKDALGWVHVEGVIGGGSSATTAFTLPAGYRLSTTTYINCIGNGGTLAFLIVAAGSVAPTGASVGTLASFTFSYYPDS